MSKKKPLPKMQAQGAAKADPGVDFSYANSLLPISENNYATLEEATRLSDKMREMRSKPPLYSPMMNPPYSSKYAPIHSPNYADLESRIQSQMHLMFTKLHDLCAVQQQSIDDLKREVTELKALLKSMFKMKREGSGF